MTHYGSRRYLTLIDCGPSRFMIWKALENETVPLLISHFVSIFRERSPPAELLLDNAPSFRSAQFIKACQSWGVRVIFRCAYRPAGNGIVERCHRTIKRMAARSQRDPLDMVFWYNFTPLRDSDGATAPGNAICNYEWRFPCERAGEADPPDVGLNVGEQVLVKPGGAKCTTQWQPGTVTRITNEGAIEVDGINRHAETCAGSVVKNTKSKTEIRAAAACTQLQQCSRCWKALTMTLTAMKRLSKTMPHLSCDAVRGLLLVLGFMTQQTFNFF